MISYLFNQKKYFKSFKNINFDEYDVKNGSQLKTYWMKKVLTNVKTNFI